MHTHRSSRPRPAPARIAVTLRRKPSVPAVMRRATLMRDPSTRWGAARRTVLPVARILAQYLVLLDASNVEVWVEISSGRVAGNRGGLGGGNQGAGQWAGWRLHPRDWSALYDDAQHGDWRLG